MLGSLSLGIGDAFAAVCGVKFGKLKIFGNKKTLEGTIAFIFSILFMSIILDFIS